MSNISTIVTQSGTFIVNDNYTGLINVTDPTLVNSSFYYTTPGSATSVEYSAVLQSAFNFCYQWNTANIARQQTNLLSTQNSYFANVNNAISAISSTMITQNSVAILSNVSNAISNISTFLSNTNVQLANLNYSTSNTNVQLANLNYSTSNTNVLLANLNYSVSNSNAQLANLNYNTSNGNTLRANTNYNISNVNTHLANLDANVYSYFTGDAPMDVFLNNKVYDIANSMNVMASAIYNINGPCGSGPMVRIFSTACNPDANTTRAIMINGLKASGTIDTIRQEIKHPTPFP